MSTFLIKEDYNWFRGNIKDLIEELQILHKQGYVEVGIDSGYEDCCFEVYRFETEDEENARICKTELKKSNGKQKLKLELIKRAKEAGFKIKLENI